MTITARLKGFIDIEKVIVAYALIDPVSDDRILSPTRENTKPTHTPILSQGQKALLRQYYDYLSLELRLFQTTQEKEKEKEKKEAKKDQATELQENSLQQLRAHLLLLKEHIKAEIKERIEKENRKNATESAARERNRTTTVGQNPSASIHVLTFNETAFNQTFLKDFETVARVVAARWHWSDFPSLMDVEGDSNNREIRGRENSATNGVNNKGNLDVTHPACVFS